ncbi:hypothetical protein B7P43_G12289 [Cryptotermes secundus]|uniref:MADF domain-containing protein n=1 Tax=Cryptotermes secundus TaxID=105785 RepID=A0A2J7PU69_9NEOP|nr:uncharacterized protein LOC111871783 [Cryptotermes secundus]XP_023720875.1 uncharacterized protein LOC111871783 [Cryptotermes secundus]XP_033610300.1 uncharacterized protein LOC111871783 [Cryptotermes secundus]PNF19878.1 hypothetical protein B7P43_G12289 [Cryptotermes secundus]
MATWSKDFLVEFIEEFRGHPCIWKVKSKEYHNREMKKNAYLALTEKMKTIDPQANKETVLKKINNLRSSFRKERKKVLMAKKSGMRSEDLYVPKLWYYKNLLFLVDQEEALDGVSSLVSDTEDLEETEQEITQKSVSPGISTHSSVSNQSAELNISTGPDISSYGCTFKRKKNQILVAVGDRLAQVKNEDRFDFFAKNVAAKLRALGNNEQRIYAEKLINDALFEAELGSLSRYSSINTGTGAYYALGP